VGSLVSLAACSVFGGSVFGGDDNNGGGGDQSSSSSGSFGGSSSGDGGKPFVCVPDPKNAEIPGNGCDDDADGTVDNAPPPCDSTATGNTAEDFAHAIGLCDEAASGKGYGLVKAEFTRGYGRKAPEHLEQHGVLGTPLGTAAGSGAVGLLIRHRWHVLLIVRHRPTARDRRTTARGVPDVGAADDRRLPRSPVRAGPNTRARRQRERRGRRGASAPDDLARPGHLRAASVGAGEPRRPVRGVGGCAGTARGDVT